MNFETFLSKEEEIYSRMRKAEKLQAEGTVPSKPVVERLAGYLIVLRHPDSITEPMQKFSERVATVVPAIVYDKRVAHTTISDYSLQPNPNFQPDNQILAAMCRGMHEAKSGLLVPTIEYSEWLASQDSAMVAGIPDAAFVDVFNKVKQSCGAQGIELRDPWGAHITTNRFMESRKPEQLSDFFALMREAPALGRSTPTAIDVGYFTCNSNGFDLQTCERFAL